MGPAVISTHVRFMTCTNRRQKVHLLHILLAVIMLELYLLVAWLLVFLFREALPVSPHPFLCTTRLLFFCLQNKRVP
jgi:hypothetical protein